jgi:CBS domain-containing protein
MTTFAYPAAPRPLVLRLSTAAELMTPTPLSFAKLMPIQQAAALLRQHGLDAAPVVDDDGFPVGLVTVSACAAWEEFSHRSSPEAGLTRSDWTSVAEIATPRIALVSVDAPSQAVVDRLVEERARRVYVVDRSGALAGAVSMTDVLRRLDVGGSRWRAPRSDAAQLC